MTKGLTLAQILMTSARPCTTFPEFGTANADGRPSMSFSTKLCIFNEMSLFDSVCVYKSMLIYVSIFLCFCYNLCGSDPGRLLTNTVVNVATVRNKHAVLITRTCWQSSFNNMNNHSEVLLNKKCRYLCIKRR